jgi:hypothetical protein
VLSILLITIRRFRTTSVDIRLQCDDENLFHQIIDPLEGEWHYKSKPTWSYRTVKAFSEGVETSREAVVQFLTRDIIPKAKELGVHVKVRFEDPKLVSTETRDYLKVGLDEHLLN